MARDEETFEQLRDRDVPGRLIEALTDAPVLPEWMIDAYTLSTLAPVSRPPTAKQLELLALLADGRTLKEAAVRMGITVETAKTHLKRAKLSLRARTTTHAVALAITLGLLRPQR